MKMLCLTVALACLLGCHGPHSHGPEGSADHAHGEEDAHAAEDHGHGHDHGGAEEEEPVQISYWNQEVELFIEHPPFRVGQPTRLVTHVTHLKGWAARTEGPIELSFRKEGATPVELVDPQPARAGIYTPTLTLPEAGTWTMELRIPLADKTSIVTLPNVRVYAAGEAVQNEPVPEGEISFLKEQQWKIPFATEPVTEMAFQEAVAVNGVIVPRAGGEAVIHAPLAGRLSFGPKGAPTVGAAIEHGQLLASLIPRIQGDQDQASLALALKKAELNVSHLRQEQERVQRLVQAKAVAGSRLAQATLEHDQAVAEYNAAQARMAQWNALQKGPSGLEAVGALELRSPLAATLITGSAVNGALVAEGDPLFHLVDLERVWLKVLLPESASGRLSQAEAAWFEVFGHEEPFQAKGLGPQLGRGGMIDLQTRQWPMWFEVDNRPGHLKIGMNVQAHVLAGPTTQGPALPLSAITEEGGQSVVYVQVSGESFTRRVVTLGTRAPKWVEVRSGLAVGERVTTVGAYSVRLAASATQVPAHGHAH